MSFVYSIVLAAAVFSCKAYTSFKSLFLLSWVQVDLLGKTAHPLYSYLMNTLRNPNGRAAVSLNFEKFLLDETGQPVRRYPRKYDSPCLKQRSCPRCETLFDACALRRGLDIESSNSTDVPLCWRTASISFFLLGGYPT